MGILKIFEPEKPNEVKQLQIVNGFWTVHGKRFNEASFDEIRLLERKVKMS